MDKAELLVGQLVRITCRERHAWMLTLYPDLVARLVTIGGCDTDDLFRYTLQSRTGRKVRFLREDFCPLDDPTEVALLELAW